MSNTLCELYFLVPITLCLLLIDCSYKFSKNLDKLNLINEFKECIKHFNEPWLQLSSKINVCVEKHINLPQDELHYLSVYPDQTIEKKVFLKLARQNDKCVWMTIGIGGDTDAEKNLLQIYPKCKIFGVEAGEKVGDFEKFGTIIKAAVGSSSLPSNSTEKIQILTQSGFQLTPVRILSLETIIKQFVPSRFVDFLTIDIEAAEFRILPDLEGSAFSEEGLTICQMDIELHHPSYQNHTMPSEWNFELFWKSFIEKSPFIPIYAVVAWNLHNKITFFNYVSQRCSKSLRSPLSFKISQNL